MSEILNWEFPTNTEDTSEQAGTATSSAIGADGALSSKQMTAHKIRYYDKTFCVPSSKGTGSTVTAARLSEL